jgi:plastocyanin
MADLQHRSRISRAVGGAVVAAALLGGGTALAADHAVSIAGFAFSPSTVTVSVGDTVTWTNSDGATHTATANDGSWDTGNIAGGGGTGAVTFATAGTFPYHCRLHTQMPGTVVVLGAAATPAPTTAPAGATTPPTNTVAAPPRGDGARNGSLGSLAIIALAWAVGMRIARRRFATAR